MQQKQAERTELLGRLERSTALQAAFPGLFDHGRVKLRFSSTNHHEYPVDFKLTIVTGNGNVLALDLADYKDEPWVMAVKPKGADANRRFDYRRRT